jgi:hypothetical protein
MMNSNRLTTTVIVSGTLILAAVIAMSGASIFTTIQPNASAQMSDAGSINMMNDTMMEPGNMTMTMSGENVTSSINLMNIISNAIGSQIKVSLSNATTIAENSIGNNSYML